MSDVENFKFYMADPNCKHVFLAAANSPLYRRALHPYREQVERVTVVRGADNTGGLSGLGFPGVTFDKVFSSPLDGMVQSGGTTQASTTARSVGVGTRAVCQACHWCSELH